MQGVTEQLRPNNLRELRSFLLKKEAECNWTQEHDESCLKFNQETKNITELTQFKRNNTGTSNVGAISEAQKAQTF